MTGGRTIKFVTAQEAVKAVKSHDDVYYRISVVNRSCVYFLQDKKDLDLAAQVKDIDVIIGGHTHTLPGTYPTIVNANGPPTLVVQAGEDGQYLGTDIPS